MYTFRLYDFAMSAVEEEFYLRKLILPMATCFIDAQHLDTDYVTFLNLLFYSLLGYHEETHTSSEIN